MINDDQIECFDYTTELSNVITYAWLEWNGNKWMRKINGRLAVIGIKDGIVYCL